MRTKTSPNNALSRLSTREQLAELGKNLPSFVYWLIQAFFTWLTGQSYPGQKPLFSSSKGYELMTALLSLFGGALASALILNSSPFLYPLLSISWLVTVGAARKSLTCIIHRCVHHQFFGDKRDRILGEILSTVLLLQGFDSYQQDHVRCHHHRDKFATFEGDPDAQFLLALGFYPSLQDSTK
jgi:hypothetical protein